jgi:hypothetical protein
LYHGKGNVGHNGAGTGFMSFHRSNFLLLLKAFVSDMID